jgi:hypothetical protein
MSTIDELEQAVSSLTRDELSEFRRWFDDYDQRAWDREIEQDIPAGRLDSLIEEALAEHRDGRTRAL